MKAIYIAVENGIRADFYTTATKGLDLPLVLTYVISNAREHEVGYIKTMENLSDYGTYRPDIPVKDRMFERLSPRQAIDLNESFMADHFIAQRIIFDFDRREMSIEHDPDICPLPIHDGTWDMPDVIFNRPEPKAEAPVEDKSIKEFDEIFPKPDPAMTEKWRQFASDVGGAYDLNEGTASGVDLIWDELITGFRGVKDTFGVDTAQTLYESIGAGGILPSELNNAAQYIQDGGNPEETAHQASLGMFES